MSAIPLTARQKEIVDLPLEGSAFIEGAAGCGKTTAAVARLRALISAGITPGSILVIVPQRTLGAPYLQAARDPALDSPGLIDLATMGGLAQRMVDLFWPLVAGAAGFARPQNPPTFLTLETAQYFMARLVRPALNQGLFESLIIDPNRLYGQILDNLNKAALVGFPYEEIGQRLSSAWIGEGSQARVYADAQECATRFRRYCLENNLLDFSLQVEVFKRHLWPLPIFREYLFSRYRHLIVDNVEEDSPFAHDILTDWLPHTQSALLVYDWEAGFRRFLAADPLSGYALKDHCQTRLTLQESFVSSPGLRGLSNRLARVLGRVSVSTEEAEPAPEEIRASFSFEYQRFYPEMLDWVAMRIDHLVNRQNVPPGEIVVLAPFLSDALRFSLSYRLERLGIPVRTHRPSRSLREEPAVRCLLTLAHLAHPEWQPRPTRTEVAFALMQSIEGLDLVRARLLAEIVYRPRENILGGFDAIRTEMQQRITYTSGQRYQALRDWIEAYRQGPKIELDAFFSRLFGEVLSQPGYGFHHNYDAGAAAATLIESARKFRWVMSAAPTLEDFTLAEEYVRMVREGVIAAQYLQAWQRGLEDAVLLAPAYTFLMANRPVEVQFWLDVGSAGWWERLDQPLTHPYVLSREWPAGRGWTDADEFETRQEALYRLAAGLIRRCRRRIFLGLCELGEQGYEQQGQLLRAFQQVLRHLPVAAEVQNV